MGRLISGLCGHGKAGGAIPSTYRARGTQGTVALRGFVQLQRALRRIEDGTQEELRSKIRKIGDVVALVAASYAPRLEEPTDSSGFPGELQHSIKTSVNSRGASVYSSAVYGGAINFGAWTRGGRGPHIKRADASHYMDRAVSSSQPFVEREVEAVMDWLTTTFQEG